jgi:ribose 5-phosphate isomerase B
MGSDHAGFGLKEHLKRTLGEMGVEIEDLGTHDEGSTDYPDYAHALAKGIADGTFELGVLVCGTGQGMNMAANRHPGVRAALCTSTFAAHMAREHNDANVLCMGSRIVGIGLADDILKSFLGAEFEGGRHARRVGKIEP